MTESDDLDDLLVTLRSPATPAEHIGQREVVELMAAAHHSSEGNTMFTSRRARVATLIAAGIIGFGGVAAAGPGGLLDGEDPVLEEPAPVVEEVPEEEAPEEETPLVEEDAEDEAPEQEVLEEEVLDEEVLDEEVLAEDLPAVVVDETVAHENDPDTAFDETTCLDGNHGKTVSAVARGESPFEDVEVRDAAHSSCGKADKAEDAADESDDDDEVEETEETEVDEQKPPKATGKPDNAGSNGKGNGKGKQGD